MDILINNYIDYHGENIDATIKVYNRIDPKAGLGYYPLDLEENLINTSNFNWKYDISRVYTQQIKITNGRTEEEDNVLKLWMWKL